MSRIGDKDTFWVLELEVAGQSYYFGDVSRDITNRYGKPTVIHVLGCNLVDAFTKAFDVATDYSADSSVSFEGLRLPIQLPDAFRAGETMVANRALLSLVRDGEDYGQKWTQVAGVVESPNIMDVQAPEHTVSFTVQQERGRVQRFPDDDYVIQPGWIASVNLAQTPAELFGWDNDDMLSDDDSDHAGDAGELTPEWLAFYLFGSTDITLEMPTEYADSPVYAPFVFGRPGIDSLTALSRDLDSNGTLDSGIPDERALGYYTTSGQTIAVRALEVEDDEGLKLHDAVDEYDSSLNIDTDESGSDKFSFVFEFRETGLYARVLVHAGEALQVGSTLRIVDRANFGTPYDTTGDYTVQLAYTTNGRPYSYVDIPADYSRYLHILDPVDRDHDTADGGGVFIVLDGDDSEFHIFNEEASGPLDGVGGHSFVDEDVVKGMWDIFYVCWISALRTGGNIGDALEAFFAIPVIQRIFEGSNASGRTYQDYHLSCFNFAMDPGGGDDPFVIRYPVVDDLTNYGVTNWTVGGQRYLDDACCENPAELIMFMCDCAGVQYDRGSLFTLRDKFRNWKIGGVIDDATDVLSYAVDVLQSFLPFSLGRSPDGITATFWNWAATKLDACHHFVEGVDLEVVGDGVAADESNVIRSLRISGRKVSWLSQGKPPFATTTAVTDDLLTEKELNKLNRLRSHQGITTGWKRGHSAARRYARYLHELRTKYGTWDFSQNFEVTEGADEYWRTNNYTGDIVSANQGHWFENPLTFPIEDEREEQWSRFMPSPILIAAFSRNKELDAEDLVLEIEELYDTDTLGRSADSLIAARANPVLTFQGISGKELGWVVEGDEVRVTAPTFGIYDEECFVAEKTWQQTNVAWRFRLKRKPQPAAHPTPNAEVSTPASEMVDTEAALTVLWVDAEGGESPDELWDLSDVDGDLVFSGSTVRDDGGWSSSPSFAILATGDGGFQVWDSGFADPPYVATVHSQILQFGADGDFWFACVLYPASNGSNPRIILGHERTATSFFVIRQTTAGRIELVKNVSGVETTILTSTSSVSLVGPTQVLFNWHGGFTSVGINGVWEASAVDHTDYNQFSSGTGSGTVRFLDSGLSGTAGDNYIGLIDDIVCRIGSYWTNATSVGATYTHPLTPT
jgi:hypothetical protein